MNGSKNKRPIFSKRIVTLILISVLILVVIAIIGIRSLIPHRGYPERILCAFNIKSLSKAMLQYAYEYNYTYPAYDRWCDLLVQHVDVPKEQFICPLASYEGEKGPCHYAMNPNCELNSPVNIVLLFETKGGWNQHGGIELLTFDNHGGKGDNVLFNNGHVEFVKPDEVGKLKWKVENH